MPNTMLDPLFLALINYCKFQMRGDLQAMKTNRELLDPIVMKTVFFLRQSQIPILCHAGEDVHNINHELAWICEIEEWVHLFYLSICLFIYLFIRYLFTYFLLINQVFIYLLGIYLLISVSIYLLIS